MKTRGRVRLASLQQTCPTLVGCFRQERIPDDAVRDEVGRSEEDLPYALISVLLRRHALQAENVYHLGIGTTEYTLTFVFLPGEIAAVA